MRRRCSSHPHALDPRSRSRCSLSQWRRDGGSVLDPRGGRLHRAARWNLRVRRSRVHPELSVPLADCALGSTPASSGDRPRARDSRRRLEDADHRPLEADGVTGYGLIVERPNAEIDQLFEEHARVRLPPNQEPLSSEMSSRSFQPRLRYDKHAEPRVRAPSGYPGRVVAGRRTWRRAVSRRCPAGHEDSSRELISWRVAGVRGAWTITASLERRRPSSGTTGMDACRRAGRDRWRPPARQGRQPCERSCAQCAVFDHPGVSVASCRRLGRKGGTRVSRKKEVWGFWAPQPGYVRLSPRLPSNDSSPGPQWMCNISTQPLVRAPPGVRLDARDLEGMCMCRCSCRWVPGCVHDVAETLE